MRDVCLVIGVLICMLCGILFTQPAIGVQPPQDHGPDANLETNGSAANNVTPEGNVITLYENTKLTYDGETPLQGGKFVNSKAFYGGIGANIQEMFRVNQMEKDQTAFFSSTAGSHEMVKLACGDVYIDKYTEKVNYNKNEPIKVILRIHAPEDSDRIRFSEEDVYVYEELFTRDSAYPQSKIYEFVNSTPEYDRFESGELIWHFYDLDSLIKTEYIEYIIKTNVSGPHLLGSTRLETINEIRLSLTRPGIYIINHPPVIENVTFPETPIWRGDKTYIKATISDPDNDQITCYLYYNGLKVNPVIELAYSDMYNYTWDLSGCSPGNHIFKIKADDGVGISETDGTYIEFREKMFGVLPYPDEYKLPVITGIVAGLMLSGILGIIKRSTKFFSRNTIIKDDDE